MKEAKVENKIDLSFELNGQPYHLTVPPTYRLVDIIRTDLQLTGTKISCEIATIRAEGVAAWHARKN